MPADEPEFAGEPLVLPKFTSAQSFSQFAPAGANVFVSIKPKQLLDFRSFRSYDKLLKQAMQGPGIGVDPSKIELVLLAANREKFEKAFSDYAEQQFAEVANLLSDEPVEIKQKPSPSELGASGLIRFVEPTSWKTVKQWVLNSTDTEIRQVRWRGLEVVSFQDFPMSVVRLDERTFLICNRNAMVNSLEHEMPENRLLSAWLGESAENGEFFIAGESRQPVIPAMSIEVAGLWGSWAEMNQFKVAIGLSEENLAKVELGFVNSKSAQRFETEIQTSITETLQLMEQTGEYQNPEFAKLAARQKEQALKFKDLLTISQNDEFVSLTLRRPAGFEEMVENYLADFNRMTKSFADDSRLREVGVEQSRSFEQSDQPDRRRQRTAKPAIKMNPVYVFTRSMDVGERITSDDVKNELWPAKLIPENAIRSEKRVIGKRTTARVSRGMPVMSSQLKNN